MATLSAHEMFRLEYGTSKNFMTPNVIKRGKIKKDMSYELSHGKGIYNDTIYGVTIVSVNEQGETTRRTELSKCCHSRGEANNYIQYLKDTAPIMDRLTLP